jgi:AraC-like DNA-binding protein
MQMLTKWFQKIGERGRQLYGRLTERLRLSRLWMFSYLVVLIVPLLVSQLFYQRSMTLANENAMEVCEIALEQTAVSFDQALSDVRSISRELITREEVASLQYADTISAVKKIKIADLKQEILLKMNFSDYISGIGVFFPHSGIGLSAEGFYASEGIVRQQVESAWGVSYDTLLETAQQSGDFHLVVRSTGGDFSQVTELLSVMTLQSVDGVPYVMLVCQLDLSQFRSLLTADGSDSSPVVWVSSADGDLILPSGSDAAQMETLIGQVTPYLSSLRRSDAIRRESLVISSTGSKLSDWELVSATSTAFYSARLGQIRLWYLVYLIICLLLGGLMAVLFTRQNYSPIKRLSELVQHEAPAEGGEFAALEDGLNQLIQKEQDYERAIERQKKSLRTTSLVRIMKGTLYSGEAFRAACRDYDLQFSGSRFGVVGILMRDYTNLFFDGKAKKDEQTQDLAHYVIIQITEELLREQYDCYICVSEDRLYAVLSAGDAVLEEQYIETVCGICQKAEAYIRERLGILLTYYVTGLHGVPGDTDDAAPTSIRAAYDAAQWGLEQIEGFGLTDPVIVRSMLSGSWQTDAQHDFTAVNLRRRQYLAATASGDFAQADQLYKELCREGIFQLEHSFSSMRIQTLMLFDQLVSALLTPHQTKEQEALLQDLSGRLAKAHDVGVLEETIHETEETIYALCHPETEQKEESYGVRVVRYIEENYTDPELSVSMVAEHFGVSQSYLLRVFKKEGSGCSVSDYIHRRRVDEAKILLKTTEETVGDIAVRVGYTNSLALIRAFKRLENGLTPSAYRAAE